MLKKYFTKEALLIGLGIVTIIVNLIFQYNWIISLYERERKIMEENIALIVKEHVTLADLSEFSRQVESPTKLLPDYMIKRVVDSIKNINPSVKKQLDTLSLKTIDSLLKDKLQVSPSRDNLLSKIQSKYPGLTVKIEILNSDNFKALDANSDGNIKVVHHMIYKPQLLKVTVLNTFEEIVKTIWQLIIFSCIYILLSTASVILLIQNTITKKKFIQTKTDVTSFMTHELKGPISILQIATDTLTKEAKNKGNNQVFEYLQVIESGLKRLDMLIESILKFTILERNKIVLYKSNIDLKAFLATIVTPLNPLFAVTNTAFNIDILDGVTILADKDQLAFIFSNLIDNSIKYNSNNPIITVTATQKSGYVEILFSDNGLGIDEQYFKSIFKPYFRVNGKLVKGYGIGLSYSKKIIEMHGGSIKILKEQGKQGVTFLIRFYNAI